MKKLSALFPFLVFAPAMALAQAPIVPLRSLPEIPASKLAPRWGFEHQHICQPPAGTDPYCSGDNPPVRQIQPSECGKIFSTSAARNQSDGSVSKKGVLILLPPVAAMTAAGIVPSTRDGQCEIQFVMGAPGPSNYLRIGLHGTLTDDKLTFIPNGAGDMTWGEVRYVYRTPGVISVQYNSVSWLLNHATPDVAELAGNGQLASHGQGRLFLVTADPTWNTVGTLVGKLAWCPTNGNGLVTNSNGGDMLWRTPYGCTFHAPTAGGPAMEYLDIGTFGASTANGIGQGAAYSGGTAPDGTVYGAGNYILLKNFAASGMESGGSITVFNGKTTLGSNIFGTWIYKVVGTDLELHEEVTADGISAPSSFVAGDTLDTAYTITVKFFGQSMFAALASSGRLTWPSNGVESVTGANKRTVIGVAQRGPTGHSGTYQDSATQRVVASAFQPVEKKCVNVYTADRTTASTSFAEPNTEIRCTFVLYDGMSTFAKAMGDTSGRAVKWSITAEVSNNTAGASCTIGAGFDGVTAEPEVAVATQPAAASGQHYTLTVHGSKAALSEAVSHYLTTLVKASSGTCTVYSATTTEEAIIWQ